PTRGSSDGAAACRWRPRPPRRLRRLEWFACALSRSPSSPRGSSRRSATSTRSGRGLSPGRTPSRASSASPWMTCSSVWAARSRSSSASGVAADLLRADAAALVVAGGYDILCRFVMRGFDALRSLTRDRVRPFDRRRSGLLLGEGAALVLMARDRDARGRRLGRLLGHASA